MLRRLCAFRGGNALLVLCVARCLSTRRLPASAAKATTPQRGAPKMHPPPAVGASPASRRQVRASRLLAGEKQQRLAPAPPKKAVASGETRAQTAARNSHKALKGTPRGRPQRRQAASRSLCAAPASLRSKTTGPRLRTDVRKGHPHAHAVQKKKYNKRVAAIAKLWRMQKKKTPKAAPAVSSKR
ncbi:uncharacterized protein Tco025E_02667 [Trypanosoma conorhini]|uniref:Kinetoplast DNA-associated protein n=1 Tax=Trypanosoma conorhini TaxID=83891 RepID=A0A422Q1W8_9TRYP|nr:uncharacterized protein Tco025E_02667 [Trypanosoma conorhini]RNF23963.1 hypothetical protein Tco025E_02667 [Trypanosoma conorhini]